jgi:hypothetical protein
MFYVVFVESLLLPLRRIRLSIQRHNVFEILYIAHPCQDLRNHTAYLHKFVAASLSLTALFQLYSFILCLYRYRWPSELLCELVWFVMRCYAYNSHNVNYSLRLLLFVVDVIETTILCKVFVYSDHIADIALVLCKLPVF